MMKYWKTLFLLTTCCTVGLMTSVRAQITPDNSLGAESSSIGADNIQGISFDRIGGGATRGANLFHSFQEFNVNNGQLVYFSNPAGIANILTRVTGVNRSNILGTLGVLGNANLFLINPNGIFFGPNARLDLGGSFVGSTANSLIFDNGFEFSATNPQAPPLLTVNIPVGLRFRDNPGNITNQSVVQDNTRSTVGLRVNPGKSLALVGGNVSLERGGSLTAAGGRIELGGLTVAGTVGLETTGNTFKLNFPINNLSNVSLADDALAAVLGNGGGDIAVNANIFTATNGGRLVGGTRGGGNGGNITVNSNEFNISGVGQSGFGAGIYQQVIGNDSTNAGNITVNSKSFNASSGGQLQNSVLFGAVGNAGNIELNTNNLILSNAQINANTFGRGNAGNVTLRAENGDISLAGGSVIFSTVESGGTGNAGAIDVTTRNLTLTDGSELQTLVRAGQQGNAGNITVQASGDVSFSGFNNIDLGGNSGFFPSGIFSEVQSGASGNAGDIIINAASIFLDDNALLRTTNASAGLAGDIRLNARDQVSIDRSTIESNGQEGRIFIGQSINNAPAFVPSSININNSTVSTTNSGATFAGDIALNARDQVSLNQSRIESNGNFGFIFIGKNDTYGDRTSSPRVVKLEGSSLSTTNESVTGADDTPFNAGNISIDAIDSISLNNRSFIQALTGRRGDAGNVTLQAENGDISLADGSYIFSTVESGGTGNAGKIDVTTRNLTLTDGSELQTLVRAGQQGNAGNITVQASGNVSFSGFNNIDLGGNSGLFPSGIFSQVQSGATGSGGDIKITAKNLSLNNSAEINASTFGIGNAGNVSVRVDDAIALANSSLITSLVGPGGEGIGGDIDIRGRTLTLTGGSQIQAALFRTVGNIPGGIGTGGSIKINASDFIYISGLNPVSRLRSGIFASAETGSTGPGGSIDITTGAFRLSNFGVVTAGTANGNNGGDITINAKTFEATNGLVQTILSGRSEADGLFSAGDIQLNVTDFVSLKDRSQINSSTSGKGNAGNISLQVGDAIALTDSSFITSNVQQGGSGKGGDIDIQGRSLTLRNGSQIQAGLFRRVGDIPGGIGTGGSIKINASDFVDISGFNPVSLLQSGIFASAETGSTGSGGSIDITTGAFRLANFGVVTAGTANGNNGGDITINAKTFEATNGLVQTILSGQGEAGRLVSAGDIQINVSDSVSLKDGSLLTSSSFGEGNAGKVSISAAGAVSLENESRIFSSIASTGKGNSGDVNIQAGSLTLKDGSVVQVGTGGQGNAGSAIIKVQNTFSADGVGSDGFSSGIYSTVQRGAVGNAGGIDISTGILYLFNGAIISGSTAGSGNAGNVTINASDRVSFAGFGSNALSSGVYSTVVENGAVGNGGNINISTGSLSLSDGAVVNALTSNSGDAGNITIKANTFTANGGGQVITTTRSSGSAGNINLNIRDRITIYGSDPNYNQRVEGTFDNQGAASGIFANTALNSTGKGGNITIQPLQNGFPKIAIADGGEVRVDSQGRGVGGEISIRGNSLTLDRGIISASTTSANGGNIDLTLRNFLRLQNESLISANARGQQGGNGGNITIDTPFIVAFPQNNDIIANAVSGSGGQVTTNATLFGIVPRTRADLERLGVRDLDPRNLSTSDITAFSEQNSNFGDNVLVNSPDVDPSRGLVELPETVSDPTQRIAQNPCQQGVGNEFVVTGRGGFPTNPNQTLSSDNVRVDLLQPVASSGNSRSATIKSATNPTATRVPAQGWIFNEKGQVVLTAYDPTNTGSQRPWRSAACSGGR